MSLKYVQTPTAYLSGSGVIIGATTITVNAFTDIYGNVLTMADFGAKGYGTFEPDTNNEESFTFTSITANANNTVTLGGVATVLAKSPYTETSGIIRQHSGGTKVVVSDTSAFWNTFANKANDEVITGTWTFNNAPVALSATPASTTTLGNTKLSVAPSRSIGTATITIANPAVVTVATHGLIAGDSVQFATTGALPTGLATNTTYFVIAAGLTTNAFEVSISAGGTAITTTGTQSGVHTALKVTPVAVTDNDPRIFPNAYAADTGAANAYVITLPTAPAALVAGQMYSFLATNANSAASTLNINGLGAKAIVHPNGDVLQSSDIAAGQIINVIYDGTSFRLGSLPPVVKFGGTGADGALNVPTGTTTITLGGAALVVKNYTSINIANGATLTFSGGHANGTIVVLKSQGAVTIAGTINGSALGATGGASASGFSSSASGNTGNAGNSFSIVFSGTNPGGPGVNNTSGSGGALKTVALQTGYFGSLVSALQLKYEHLWSSAGGGSGGAFFNSSGGSFTSGAGGNAGLTLLIECGGALNAQGTVNLSGGVGGLASVSGGQQSAGGGGGGAGGFFMCLYNALTANSLTINVAGGTGGNSVFTSNVAAAGAGGGGSSLPNAGNNGTNVTSGQGGGNGAAGTSIVLQNTEYV